MDLLAEGRAPVEGVDVRPLEEGDIDECAAGTDTCDATEECENNEGGHTCVCRSGFVPVGAACIDIDECQLATDNCRDDVVCANTPGAFTCTCPTGFSGDGVTTCTEVAN